MDRKPTKRDSNIISKEMFKQIIINGLYISLIFILQTVFNFLGGTKEKSGTILFTLFVVFQLFNSFNCRELGNKSILKNITNNKLMLLVFGIVFALQILIIQFGGAFFGTVPLPLNMWIKIIGVSFTVLIISELVRLTQRIISKSAHSINK